MTLIEMTMKDLCNQLKQIKGKFSLSYYDFDLLSQWLPIFKNKFVWEQKEFTKQDSIDILKRMVLVIKVLSY